eukprot:TRINITY_DN148_c0_g1_i2.p1 TRINITY_DN148_c0_g1~~TRINITY_DN148_c0_g1_i2.p1  ORF type:complete len:181 (-),score=48.95 TRINITY_DN148_c0_g1_i2:1751-2293(-)
MRSIAPIKADTIHLSVISFLQDETIRQGMEQCFGFQHELRQVKSQTHGVCYKFGQMTGAYLDLQIPKQKMVQQQQQQSHSYLEDMPPVDAIVNMESRNRMQWMWKMEKQREEVGRMVLETVGYDVLRGYDLRGWKVVWDASGGDRHGDVVNVDKQTIVLKGMDDVDRVEEWLFDHQYNAS